MVSLRRLAPLMLVACAGSPAPAPPPSDLVTRCAALVDEADDARPPEETALVAVECLAPRLRDDACRSAIAHTSREPAVTRVGMLTPICAVAYCPLVDEPRPGLCSRVPSELTPAEMMFHSAELFTWIRVHELGPEDAARWDRLVGVPVAPEPEPPPPTTSLTVGMSVRGEALELVMGGESWTLPANPRDADFEAPARRAAQLANELPDDQVVIEVGPGILYHHLVGWLNALGKRRLRNITVTSPKT